MSFFSSCLQILCHVPLPRRVRGSHSHVTSTKDPGHCCGKPSTFQSYQSFAWKTTVWQLPFVPAVEYFPTYRVNRHVTFLTCATMNLSPAPSDWLTWAAASSVLAVPASEGLWGTPGLFLKYWTTKITCGEREDQRRSRGRKVKRKNICVIKKKKKMLLIILLLFDTQLFPVLWCKSTLSLLGMNCALWIKLTLIDSG